MASKDELIVADGNYKYASFKMKDLGGMMEEALVYYNKILAYILSDSVHDQLIRAGYQKALSKVRPLPEKVTELATRLEQLNLDYIHEIDVADQFLG